MAIAAARPVLESLLAPGSACSTEATQHAPDSVIDRWLGRWTRAGWLSERAEAGDLVNVAISAGNAGKINRRNVTRRNVLADDGVTALQKLLEHAFTSTH